MADGKPLDVGWAANPAAADIDADGDLDLIRRGLAEVGQRDVLPRLRKTSWRIYENIGTRSASVLTMKPLPRIGEFPNEIIASPTLADWDGDGDLDLTVSTCTGAVYLFENAGSAGQAAIRFTTRPAASVSVEQRSAAVCQRDHRLERRSGSLILYSASELLWARRRNCLSNSGR
jgi:hypothetical protein